MFIVWVIGCIILGSVTAYFFGQMDDHDLEDVAAPIIAGVFLWPLVLAVAVVIGPFIIPFILGSRKKNKDKKNG
jgi:hypothetical protein